MNNKSSKMTPVIQTEHICAQAEVISSLKKITNDIYEKSGTMEDTINKIYSLMQGPLDRPSDGLVARLEDVESLSKELLENQRIISSTLSAMAPWFKALKYMVAVIIPLALTGVVALIVAFLTHKIEFI